jgi:signal transduction histidine kinase
MKAEKLQFFRRFIILSPLITVLTIIGFLLTIGMIFLGITIYAQLESNRATLGFNFSSVNRPFSQFERELLSLLAVVQTEPEKRDPDALKLNRQVLDSRWEVIFWPSVQEAFSPEIKEATERMTVLWNQMQEQLTALETEPDSPAKQEAVAQTIIELDTLVFQTDVRYQSQRGLLLSQANDTSERLIIALGVVTFFTAGFIVLAAISIRRFVQAQQKVEEKARVALAAEAAALENNRFKDQFLAVMSHELRTPLNAMIGFLGIMQMSGKFDDRNKHMLDRTRANAERLLNLINDILDLSKIESGRMELIPTPVSPIDMAKQWQYQMDVLARQKGVAFHVEVDEKLPVKLLIDEGAITKIAVNLLSNAFKFTEKGEVHLRLKSLGTEWAIEVSDTGIGIPTHMHETIFESFRQVDNSFKRTYGGTGLGLSIIQHLVKAMDGNIRLQSVIGQGTTFTVTLPVQTAQVVSPEVQLA